MNIQFDNKTVLITGGTRGIGKQIADDFHDLGATVIITGTNADQIAELNIKSEQQSDRKIFYKVDFSSKEDTLRFIEIISKLPKIDVLVNNAGINKLNFIDDVLTDDWDNMISVNLSGPFHLIRIVSAKMKTAKYGRIINIASIFSKISKERRSVYSATKFGIHGLTVGVSNDLSRFNILVNTVSPGFIMTDLTKKNLSSNEIEMLTQQIPAKRMGETKDIANTVIFLASHFNTYITGQNIIVDGGFVNV
jgi:3-oxoacyl-[acyl-carrier protein] reductase